MKQLFIKCGENNLTACLKKCQNQYGLISKDVDWDEYNQTAAAHAKFQEKWPHSIGDGFTTKIEQDEETGEWHFNIQATDEQIASLGSVPPTPAFSYQYEGETDAQGESLPLPTYKTKVYDVDGNWTGTYSDRTVCVMR